jgi:hypothetical protein
MYEDVAHVAAALEDGRPLVATMERLASGVEDLLREFSQEFEFAPVKDADGGWA